MTITMYDAIPEDFGNVPAHVEAIASYIDNFGGYTEAVKRWPDAHHLSITTFGGRARMADMEAGAMSLAAFPGWYHEDAIHDEGLPIGYTSASNVAELIRINQAARLARSSYLILSAHYGHGPHICGPKTCGFPQADGTQWTDTVDGRDCDVSLLSDRFFEAVHRQRAHGRAFVNVSLDLARGHWHVKHEKGTAVYGPEDRWASAELQINVRTGETRIRPLAWNAKPLGR